MTTIINPPASIYFTCIAWPVGSSVMIRLLDFEVKESVLDVKLLRLLVSLVDPITTTRRDEIVI